MKILPVTVNMNQTYFYGSKNQKYEKLPDYQSYYHDKDTYGSIEPLPKAKAENVIKLLKNDDLKAFAQNMYVKEHYLSGNMAGLLLGMDAGFENIKDKYINNLLNRSLEEISKNMENNSKIYYDYDMVMQVISDIIDSYNSLNGIYSRYYVPYFSLDTVKYKNSPAKHYLETINRKTKYIAMATNEDLEAIFNRTKDNNYTTHAKAIVENQRIEPFSYIAKYREISDYMYVKYYLNTNKIHPEVRKMCLDILDQFGTQVILPYPDKKHNINDLKMIKKELNLWKKYGKEEAIFPHFINLSYINNKYTDDKAAGYYSSFLEGIYLNGRIKETLRHEMTHLNDRLQHVSVPKDKKYIKFLNSIMPSKTIIVNGRATTVQDFENCKYREEFLKAGVFPSDIEYAYTNKGEFIAVASQGDMSQYSDEFKQVLVKMGLPEYALKLPQTNNEILSNVAQVKRVMKKHPECKDYNSILQYCEY